MRIHFVRRSTAFGRQRWSGAGVALGLLAALISLALAGCDANSSSAQTSAGPSSASLLSAAQAKFSAAQTFHFKLTTQNAGSGSFNGVSVIGAEGDVQRPDRIQATVTVPLFFSSVDVAVIGVGDKVWYKAGNHYESADQYGSFGRIFDAQDGIGSLITKLQKPSAAQSATANGVDCWKVSGTLSPDDLKQIFGADVTDKPVPTTFYIGKSDSQLYQVVISGVLLSGDQQQTTRTFALSRYGEALNIQPPA